MFSAKEPVLQESATIACKYNAGGLTESISHIYSEEIAQHGSTLLGCNHLMGMPGTALSGRPSVR